MLAPEPSRLRNAQARRRDELHKNGMSVGNHGEENPQLLSAERLGLLLVVLTDLITDR